MSFFDDSLEASHRAMHPNGSCTCAGEGLCSWCMAAAVAQGQDESAFNLRDPRSWFDDVLKFVRGAQGAAAIPESIDFENKNVELYWKLIEEELLEMQKGFAERDPVEFADGIADTIWVLMGLAIASGIDLRPVWAEVARSNLDKLGGPRRADGKLMKPAGWKPPDIVSALKRGRVR